MAREREPWPTPSREDAERELDMELNDLTRGDAARVEILRASLRRLADGSAGPALQEMAREVLSGRRSLRDVATSDVYGEALFENCTRFWKKVERLPEDERRRLMESSANTLVKLRAKLESREAGT